MTIIRRLSAIFFGAVLVCSAPALTQARWSLTPRLSLQGQYDDNIFLDDESMDDFITTISPGINLTYQDPSQEIGLDYAQSIEKVVILR